MSDPWVAFVRARLAEDEAVARHAKPGPWHWVDPGGQVKVALVSGSYRGTQEGGWDCVVEAHSHGPDVRDGEHIARHDPARVLREVAALRAVLARVLRYEASLDGEYGDGHSAAELEAGECEGASGKLAGVRLMAAIWGSHPDYAALAAG